MSGLKNSPYGKRLRATRDDEEETPRRNRPRYDSIFSQPSDTPPLVDSPSTSASASRSESPTRPVTDYGDRFVPSRDAGDMRTSYHLKDERPPTPSKVIPTESDALKEESNEVFGDILHGEVTPPRPESPTEVAPAPLTAPSTPTHKHIFSFKSPSKKRPGTPSKPRLDKPTDETYCLSPIRHENRSRLESPRRQLRSVCKTPYRVLDAPDLTEDFYLNLVDWSSTNVLGVGLGACVYLWTAENATVSKLCDVGPQNDTISSVSWVQKGSTLAVGTLSGRLHLYDASTLQLQRTYEQAHTLRIGSLAWNAHVLTSGSRDRFVHHRDVREPTIQPFRRCSGHRQEVCGLKWSVEGGPQQALLASGGNDNKVCVWDIRSSVRPGGSLGIGPRQSRLTNGSSEDVIDDAPLWKFHEHTAAVKALAWDPHISGVLATGGGTNDTHIRFWNTINGKLMSQLNTGSQVCNLVWSITSHELVSTHGYSCSTAQNQICIWKYPTLEMVASLTGHGSRVLYLAMSPDGETIVTGAGDETLRFWNAFPKREVDDAGRDSRLDYGRLIR